MVNDTPDPGSLIRSDSNESMQSALSSLGNTGSWTGSYMHDPIGKYFNFPQILKIAIFGQFGSKNWLFFLPIPIFPAFDHFLG